MIYLVCGQVGRLAVEGGWVCGVAGQLEQVGADGVLVLLGERVLVQVMALVEGRRPR